VALKPWLVIKTIFFPSKLLAWLFGSDQVSWGKQNCWGSRHLLVFAVCWFHNCGMFHWGICSVVCVALC
jgi:hypothetical protein